MNREIGVRTSTATHLRRRASAGARVSKTCVAGSTPDGGAKFAGVVQWQDRRLPTCRWAFDSPHPHHARVAKLDTAPRYEREDVQVRILPRAPLADVV